MLVLVTLPHDVLAPVKVTGTANTFEATFNFPSVRFASNTMVILNAGAPQRTVRLLFNRGPGADFSERDVTVLTLLRPHLQAAYDESERRRRHPNPLTGRQRQVLALVAAGQTNLAVGTFTESAVTVTVTY